MQYIPLILPLESTVGFPSWDPLARFRKTLLIKLSEVYLSCGDVFIMIKVNTQEGNDWLIVWSCV